MPVPFYKTVTFTHNYFMPCLLMQYQSEPISWFQKKIRGSMNMLTDHISKEMNELNLIRCQRIPKRPGSDWRDLPDEKVSTKPFLSFVF